MGTTCTLRRATQAEINRLLATPEDVAAFLYGDALGAPPVEVVRLPGLTGFLMRFFPITITQTAAPPPGRADAAPNPEPGRQDDTDLDKAWHGLHFLFTNTAWEGAEPACYLLVGGDDIGDEDAGAARALDSAHVRRFADFLDGLSREELTRRYDPARMVELEIYPEEVWTRATDESLEYLLENFEILRTFVRSVAERGDGLIVSVY
jgi:hypothetical protein